MAKIQSKEINLEQAQDMLLTEMTAVKTMYKQLQSEDFQQRYEAKNGKAAYRNWRERALTAYEAKTEDVKEIRSYIAQKFDFHYKTLSEIQLAVKERNFSAPDWLQETESASLEDLPLFQNGNGKTPETETVQEVPAVNQIELSPENDTLRLQILDRLIQARHNVKASQRDVADAFGFSAQTTIGAWERGKSPITLENLFRLCQLYNVDPLYIITGKESLSYENLKAVAGQLAIDIELLHKLLGS